MQKYNLVIRIEDSDNPSVYTEVRHEECPIFGLINMPFIGTLLEQHIDLKKEKLKRLEVTL